MTTAPDRPYLFHAFEVSYFSAKVRPALRYKRLWVDEVRPDKEKVRVMVQVFGRATPVELDYTQLEKA